MTMTPDPATRVQKLAAHSHAFGCECRSDYDDERCVKLCVRLQGAIAALTEPPGRGPETGPDVERLRTALVQARGFIDVAVRAWMPNEHANCAIDSGCAHGADEREIFEELDHQVEAINKALGSLTPGSEAPATRGRDRRRGGTR